MPQVSDLARHYFSSINYSKLAANTKLAYESAWRSVQLNKLVAIPFKNMDCALVSPMMVEKLKDTIFFERGPSAAKITFALLNNIWKKGQRLGLVQGNPWQAPDLPSSKKRNTMWNHQQITRFVFLSREQFNWRDLATIFLLCYETGQRPIDILMLKLSHFENGKVSFFQQKTGAPVSFLIPPYLASAITRQLAFSKKYSPNGWLFPDQAGSYRSYDWFAKKVDFIKQQDKIFEGLQIRDLRRTAITETLNAGASDWETQNFSGHKNIASMKPYKVANNAQTEQAQVKRWGARTESMQSLEEQPESKV